MSELTNTTTTDRIRWRLLVGASILALLGATSVLAEESDRPAVWIELGGQLERVNAGEQQFAPPFILATPRPAPETVSPLSVRHLPNYNVGGEGKITFEPADTNLVFSVQVRYGRSISAKHLHQQSYPTKTNPNNKATSFSDAETHGKESYTILDFQAGKDVGVGLFGARSSSVFSIGLRFAQFGSKSSFAFKSIPDAPNPKYVTYAPFVYHFRYGGTYHSNAARLTSTRNFHGLGPSISWSASAPIAGGVQSGELAFDWGVNAAALFGRQKANVHHQTTALYHKGKYSHYRTTLYRNNPPDHVRSRSVVVPNIGGFAGVSFRYAQAKLSLGYKADFFFGAMDGGIDTRKEENRNFYGPFAAISVGLP